MYKLVTHEQHGKSKYELVDVVIKGLLKNP